MSQPIVNVVGANQPVRYEADTLGGHGEEYQRRLAYYLIVEAMLNETPFQLTFEMKNYAGKFDDVGLLVRGKWHIFQSKHEQGDPSTIGKNTLFNRKEADFSLIKYYNGYKNMIGYADGISKWDHGEITNLIFFTNRPINNYVFKESSRCKIELDNNRFIDLPEGNHIRFVSAEKEMIEILEEKAFIKDSKNIQAAIVNLFKNKVPDQILEKYKAFIKIILVIVNENGGEKIGFNTEHLTELQNKKTNSDKEKLVLDLYRNTRMELDVIHFENITVSKQKMGNFWEVADSDIQDEALLKRDLERLSSYIYNLLKNIEVNDQESLSCFIKHRKLLKDMFICEGNVVKIVKALDKSSPLFKLHENLRSKISTEYFESLSVPKDKMGENFWTKSEGQIISDRELATLKDFLSKLVLFVGQPNVDVLKDLIITKLRCWVRTTVRPDHFGRMDSSVFKGLLNIVEKHFGEYEKKFTNNSKKEKDAFGEEDTRELFAKIKQQIQNEVEKTRKDSDELSQCYISRKMENGTSEAEFVQTLCTSDNSQKCFIFTAQPGMGKTTLMQSLAFETQKYGKENTEVFLIYLNNFLDEIPEINSLQDILDKNVFKSSLSTEHIQFLVENRDKQIILFFDGFDEITERNEDKNEDKNEYKKKDKNKDKKSDENRKRILKLIDVLQSKDNIKIIISGRKNVREELEKHLNVTSLELQAFSKNDQIEYFEKFWKIDAKNKIKFEEFASEILKKLESDLSNQAQTFIGVPLMTWMVAEIFAEPVVQFLNSNVAFKKFITKRKFNIIYLFEEFAKTSSRIMINKKYNADKNVVLDPVFGEVIKKTVYFYQIFAMEECFGEFKSLIQFVTNRKYLESLQIFKKQFQHYQSLVLEAFANRPRFTHLLFRDYFAATFLFEAIGRLNDNFLNVVSYLPSDESVVFDFLLALINSSMDKDESEYNLMVATNNHLLLLERLKKEAILMSCQRDYIKIVEYLRPMHNSFTYGASIINNGKGKPLLQITFESGSKLVDQYLVELLEHKTNCEYPLHELVEINRLDLVEQFINENNINLTNDSGDPPLFLAKSFEMFEILIKHGSKFGHKNSNNENIFHKLVTNVTKQELVKILQYAKKESFQISEYINQENKKGKNALDFAVEDGNIEIVEYLIVECNAIKTKAFRNAGIFHYYSYNSKDKIHIIQTCLKIGLDINAKYKGNTALHNVAKMNNLEAVIMLIDKGAEINVRNNEGKTPLHEALEYKICGRYDVAEFLIKENIPGIVYNVTDNQGQNLLHLAAKLLDKSFLEVLLKKYLESSLSLDEKNNYGKTALQIAADTGNESNVELLLQNGANVDMFAIKTLLMRAENKSYRSNIKLLHIFNLIDKSLFETNVDILECFDIKGQTALHLVAKYGFKNVLIHMIDKGTDVNITNTQGQTPLHLACSKEIFDLLKSAGSVEHINDNDENTGLHFAAENGNIEMLQLLIKHKKRVIDCQNKMGQSALHLAMQKLNNNVDGSDLNVKILKLLINNGANTSLNDNHGKSPLLYGLVSSMYNSIDDLNYLLVEMIDKLDSQKSADLSFNYLHYAFPEKTLVDALLKKVGDVNIRDEKGRTFLHYAAAECGDNIVKLLISKGADVNARDDFNNIPLHFACKHNLADNFSYLADLSSNINHKNNEGETPLHLALQNSEHIAKILIAKNASIHLADSEGNTPLHLAILHQKEKNALLLIKLLDPPELNRPNNKGETALQIAAEKKQELIVKLLLESGANANIVFKKLLKSAEEKINDGNIEYQKILNTFWYLFEIIHKYKFANLNGQTALHLAAKYGFKTILKCWKGAVKDVDIENSDGQTPLLLARNKDTFEALIDLGASRNKKDAHGNTGLHIAVNFGNVEMVRYLIETNNCDIDCQNKMGKTALHLALSRQPDDFIFYVLFDKKASIRLADNEGNTPLHLAILHQRRDISFWLITQLPLSELNRPNNKGETALHLAVLNNELNMVKRLVMKGVQLDSKTRENKTALDLAKAHNLKKIYGFLKTKTEELESQANSQAESESKSQLEIVS